MESLLRDGDPVDTKVPNTAVRRCPHPCQSRESTLRTDCPSEECILGPHGRGQRLRHGGAILRDEHSGMSPHFPVMS